MIRHLGIYYGLFPSTAIWEFKTTGEAYKRGHGWGNTINHGDILFIPSEGVVGFADHRLKDPFALSKQHGKLSSVFEEYSKLGGTLADRVWAHCSNLCITRGNFTCATFVAFTMDEVAA